MSAATTVLLVEDDRHIALALQIRLSAAGFCVVLGASVGQAITLVEKQVPDVAVLDINLPDGNGLDLMKRFASMKGTASIATIIMTASRKPGLREQALAMGACRCFKRCCVEFQLLLCKTVSRRFSHHRAKGSVIVVQIKNQAASIYQGLNQRHLGFVEAIAFKS